MLMHASIFAHASHAYRISGDAARREETHEPVENLQPL